MIGRSVGCVFAALCIQCTLPYRFANLAPSDDEEVEQYKVLSYNICWGCMEANTGDKTGMKQDLKRECVKTTLIKSPGKESVSGNSVGSRVTKCAKNMGESIAKYWNAIDGYDLMGFQEASNFGHLYLHKKLPNIDSYEYGTKIHGVDYGKGTVLKGRTKRAWIVSAWDKTKLGNYSAVAEGAPKCDPGRPFLALAFDSKRLIFINVHNTQPKGGFDCWKNIHHHIEKSLNQQMFADKPERKNYRVIMVGDFNDRLGKLPGIKIPWSKPEAKMKLKKPLAPSCCKTKLRADPKNPGDYIFDSASVAKNKVPALYNNSVPQSDHRPVEAVLGKTDSSKEDYDKTRDSKDEPDDDDEGEDDEDDEASETTRPTTPLKTALSNFARIFNPTSSAPRGQKKNGQSDRAKSPRGSARRDSAHKRGSTRDSAHKRGTTRDSGHKRGTTRDSGHKRGTTRTKRS